MSGPEQPSYFPWTGTIIPWSAALLNKPDHDSRTLADVPRGEPVTVLSRAHGWLYVAVNPPGKRTLIGYVSKELIKYVPVKNTVAVTPQTNASPVLKTKADWQFIARQNAFGLELAQQITKGVAWLPSQGFAANKHIIAKLYDYYGALYRRSPGKLQWAGLARMAGGPFFQGFCDMEKERARAQSTLDWYREHYIQAAFQSMVQREQGGLDPEMLARTEVANLEQGLRVLMEMGRDIFNDLAWQHEAYLVMGLPEIRRLAPFGPTFRTSRC